MASLVIGLTGGIGSGKTTVSNIFADLGIDIIDADEVAREVVAPGSNALVQIAEHFGDKYIQKGGELNRALLRTKIFGNEQAKKWLNNLLHPLIRLEIKAQLESSSSSYCILSAPLLLENKLNHLIDTILVIDISVENQLKRTLLRDGSSEQVIRSIIASQISREERLERADDVITNQDISKDELIKNVEELHQKYLAMAKKR